MVSRDGRPEGTLSIYTGYEICLEPNQKMQAEILDFYNSIFDDTPMKDYKPKANAYGIHGSQYLKQFGRICYLLATSFMFS